MYLSSSDGVNGVDVDDNSEKRQENTPPVTPNSPSPSFTSCPTLLVIDDNSNSDDSSLKTNDILSNLSPSNAQTTHVQATPSSPLSNIDNSNDTPDQQRRRNSSIAKLLGGQPLNNQQYEEINQQILDDQSAQNVTSNSDNKIDSGLQRSRSSLTRSLLMNAEGNNNASTTITKARPSSPVFSKDFEYLIRRELDIDHGPSTLHRDDSTPSVFQNLTSARNIPPANAQSPSQSKLKRKRPNPKQTIPTPTANKPTNNAPFVIRDPFELDSPAPSLVPPINSTTMHRSQHHQNDLFRFDIAPLHHHHHHLIPQQQQQQYSLPMNNSTSFTRQKLNLNSPAYAQFKVHHDRHSSTPSCSSSPSSFNCCRYPPATELALPTPVSPLSPHASLQSILPYHTIATSSRKTKAMHTRPDMYENPMQRLCSTISNQSNTSSSSSSSSSGHSIPLKKRLLHAYNNEQRPSSSL